MTTKGCVLIHGFTGNPEEIKILADHLQSKGVRVSTPTLPGHSSNLDKKEMRRANRKDWLKTAEGSLLEMMNQVEEVYLIGFSMGGMIATYLTSKYPVKKLVLLSASVYYINPKKAISDIKNRPLSKEQFMRYLYKIKGTPIKATWHFRKLVKELKPYIDYIHVPTIIIQGEMDNLVDPRSAKYIYDTIKSKEKELHYLPKSKHIVCLDCEREKVVELVDQFLF